MVTRRIVILILLSLVLFSGCQGTKSEKTSEIMAEKYTDTIRSLCDLVGYEGIDVSGYSLVWGLKGTGSAECPPDIREVLNKHIQVLKASGRKYLEDKYARMSPEQLINSLDTAVVRVNGVVPAGAPKGTRFDVNVTIPFATQTISLEGGTLLPTDLRRVTSGIPGSPVAIAGGPIYIDPLPVYVDGEERRADPRFGVVLGGGRSDYDRQIMLVMYEPDSRYAELVVSRINSRFPVTGELKVAIPEDRERIYINIPKQWINDYNHFIKILLKLYINNSSAYQEQKLKELGEQAKDPDANFEEIILSWEAIGKGAMPYLKELCEEIETPKAYYAAKTILNMGDISIIKVLSTIARSETHVCRAKAATALGNVVNDPLASWTLAGLLDSKEDSMRLIAYDSLRKGNHIYVNSEKVYSNFHVDTVRSSGANMVCAWAAMEPRIVVMGNSVRLADNIFYRNESMGLMINSRAGESVITVTRQLPGSTNFVTIKTLSRVDSLAKVLGGPLRDQVGAGLSFGQTIGVVNDLCEGGFVDAMFKMKRLTDNLEQVTSDKK